ncbi:MAG: ABC transporter substrate-binding protein [Coriobacteriia bacterium]
MKRPMRVLFALMALMLSGAFVLSGCSSDKKATGEASGSNGSAAKPAAIKIGTLATQDSLPLWVAEDKGYFAKEGLGDVEIVVFQSAQECQAAFQAGAVDALMTDLIVAAKLQAAGTPVTIPTVMLGSDTSQGRFAIVAAPGSGIETMSDLKGVPVGTAAATITEYIFDKLMEQAGVSASDIKTEEVPKMPVRFQLMMAGTLKAASLPEPFVSLAEQGGATVVSGGDDTKSSENISQSVLCVSKKYTESAEGSAALSALLKAWDDAVTDINANPDSFRETLVKKANLPDTLASSYQVSEYPKAAPPSKADVQKVLDWMKQKGYLTAEVTPEDLLGK